MTPLAGSFHSTRSMRRAAAAIGQKANILGHHQFDLSVRFTERLKNRFEDLAVAFSSDRLPLLQGAAGQLCCRVAAIHKACDHDVVLGEVFSGEEAACSPLVFHRGAYGSFHSIEP
jgi:flavin reductase (DIM6/NTAB) family NADH-FMN oxidoreductase RutF